MTRGVVGLIVVIGVTGILFGIAFARVPGDQPFTYPLDDAFIHLAMARQLIEHGTWGVTPHEFAPASSSPGWTLLLATLGGGELVPLALNLLVAFVFVCLVYRRMLPRLGPAGATGSSIALVLVVPLVPLAFLGMEHVLHALLAVSVATLATGDPLDRRGRIILGALAFAAGAMRYESLFLIGALTGVLALSRSRRVEAGIVLGAGVAPAIIGGIASMMAGGPFLPTSILLKGRFPPGGDLGEWGQYLTTGLRALIADKELGAIVVLTILGSIAARRAGRFAESRLSLVAAITVLAHVQFARVGWFGRYEAYLIALGGVALAGHLPELRSMFPPGRSLRRWLALLVIGTALVGAWGTLVHRVTRGFRKLPRAMKNVHQQQRQMARFIREHYSGQAVALNDIGAVCAGADISLLDFWGLGDPEVAGLIRAGSWNASTAATLAEKRGVTMAILYEDHFARIIPPDWRPVARWTIPDNVACASATVTLFARDPEGEARLRHRLEEFQPTMPTEVRVEFVEGER